MAIIPLADFEQAKDRLVPFMESKTRMSTVATGNTSTDREARLRFMRITNETGIHLREFWTVVESALPSILDTFYRHITLEPNLARMIGNDIPRLKTAQGSHWARLFNGRFDETYINGVRTIGLIHNKIGLEPRWYIGGYNLVLSMLQELAVKTYRRKPAKLNAVQMAVNSAVMLDMDFAISVYQEAMLTERQARQDKVTKAIEAFDTKSKTALGAVAGAANQVQSTANNLSGNAQQARRYVTSGNSGERELFHSYQGCAFTTTEVYNT